jgi:hypothetical protein
MKIDGILVRFNAFPAKGTDAIDLDDDQAELDALAARFEAEAEQLNREYEAIHGYEAPAPAPRRSQGVDAVASAWHNGYTLGESGYEPHQVAAPSHYTADERNAFISGLTDGAAERWADYERHLAQQDAYARLIDPFAGVEEHEYAEAGSADGHMA